MSLTKVSYFMTDGAPVNILDYGADPTGSASSYQALVSALAAGDALYIPPGTYKVDQQINITGNKIIFGLGGNNYAEMPAIINFTAVSGNLFSAIGAEFGGIVIRNLNIIGGNGSYAIRSSRVQSVFENLYMEPFNGGGIELFEAGTASQASWGTAIRNVKWTAPSTPTAYRGIQVAQNGGNLRIERCMLTYGSIGINIDQGEAIEIVNCNISQQNSNRSSLSANNQCSIRLSGSGYKKAISILGNYIEGSTHAIWVDKCESLTIQDNYCADVGFNSNYASIYLKDSNVNNVTIKNNNINDNGNNSASIDIDDGAKNVVVENNYMRLTGTNSIGIRKGTTTYSWIQNNDIEVNVGTGTKISDPNRLISNTDYQQNGFFNYQLIDFVSADNTWYVLGAVLRTQIWRVLICDSNNPSANTFAFDLYMNKSADTSNLIHTVYSVNTVSPIAREIRVNAGNLEFRTVNAGGNTANTITALRVV